MVRFILVLITFSVVCSVKSQSTFVNGIFPTIDHSGILSRKFDYSLYYFAAFPLVNLKQPDIVKDAGFLLLYAEQALSFKVTVKLSFTGSYVYQRSNVVSNNYANENRVYAQATYKHYIKSINIKHRLRFDNRFIQDRITGRTPYTNRIRYLMGVNIPIKDKLYFTAYEEVFFNTYKGLTAIYAENWAYAAVGIKLNEKNRIEAGPLYITWNTGANTWFNQYYVQITWVSNINIVKSKRKEQ